MTREEQLDALVREALEKIDNVPVELDLSQRKGSRYDYNAVYRFAKWLRAEFIRTQAP